MKTTIELPDELFRQAKELASRLEVPMRTLVVEGLRAEVARRSSTPVRADFVFPTAGGGGLLPGVDPKNLIAMAYDDPS